MEFSKRFVCASREAATEYRHVPAPAFRLTFCVQKAEEATLTICSPGFYELFLNGEKITKGFLAPYIANPDDLLYYDRYDLLPLLREGENVLGAVLGNGMNNPMTHTWNFKNAIYRSAPRMALTLAVTENGEQRLYDAGDFLCHPSPITFDNLRYGVRYDARLEESGWCEAGFDASSWSAPLPAETPRGRARLCEAEPIRVRAEITPLSVRPGEMAPYTSPGYLRGQSEGDPGDPSPRTGGVLYDFGINTAGVFRLRLRGAKAGQVISLQCGEYLNEAGQLVYQKSASFFPDGYTQRDIYIARGDAEEIFVPMFTYHGYRYLYVYGLTAEQAVPETITYLALSSDLTPRADFRCSDTVAEKIHAAALNSDLSNFVYFPTDCPHREKNGWTGDAAASAEHMILHFSVERSWREWLCNIRAAQNEAGALPGIVPTAGWGFDWGNGPAWDRVLFDLPYTVYLYRGDTDIIRENRHAMMRYLEYAASRRRPDGLIAIGLGDWVPVGDRRADNYRTPLHFTDSVMLYDMCVKAEKMFSVIGATLNAEYAASLGRQVRAAIRRHCLNLSEMTTHCRSQSGLAMAIYYGIFEESEKPLAARNLTHLIRRCGGNMEGGYLGLRVMFHVLAEFGEAELAYRMITKPDFPSYAYYIHRGFTSLPEKFMPDEMSCSSLNHHFLGDVSHWFVRHVAGIGVNPDGDDPNRIRIAPRFIPDLQYAEGRYDAPGGSVWVRWEREGENIRLRLRHTGEIRCELRLPDGYRLGCEQGYQAQTANPSEELVITPVG